MPPQSIKDVRRLTQGLRAAVAASRKIVPAPPAQGGSAPGLPPSPIALRRQGL